MVYKNINSEKSNNTFKHKVLDIRIISGDFCVAFPTSPLNNILSHDVNFVFEEIINII